MAIAQVQQGDSGTGPTSSGSSFSLGSNVTAGNAVVLCIATSDPTASVSAVSGGGITNWTLIGTHINISSAEGLEMWWGSGSTGGSAAITVTASGGYYAQATEFSGIGTLSSTAQTGPGTVAVSTFAQAITPAAGQLVVMAACESGLITAFSGLTNDYNGAATAPAWRWSSGLDSAWQIASTTGTLTGTWTSSAAGSHYGIVAAVFSVPTLLPPQAGRSRSRHGQVARGHTPSWTFGIDLLTGDSSSFEGGTKGIWITQSVCTTSIQTTRPHSGTQSLRAVATGGTATGPFVSNTAVVPGQVYYFCGWVYAATTASVNVQFNMAWHSPSALMTIVNGTAAHPTLNGWQFYSVSGTAPVGASAVTLQMYAASSTSGDTYYYDDLRFIQQSYTNPPLWPPVWQIARPIPSKRHYVYRHGHRRLNSADWPYGIGYNTGDSSSAEGGTVGTWFSQSTGTAPTIAASSAQAYSGTQSILVTNNGASNLNVAAAGVTSKPGDTFTASGWIYASSTRSFQIKIVWQAGTSFRTQSIFTQSCTANTWVYLTVTGTHPYGYGTNSAALQMYDSSTTSGPTFAMDDMQLVFRGWTSPANATIMQADRSSRARTAPRSPRRPQTIWAAPIPQSVLAAPARVDPVHRQGLRIGNLRHGSTDRFPYDQALAPGRVDVGKRSPARFFWLRHGNSVQVPYGQALSPAPPRVDITRRPLPRLVALRRGSAERFPFGQIFVPPRVPEPRRSSSRRIGFRRAATDRLVREDVLPQVPRTMRRAPAVRSQRSIARSILSVLSAPFPHILRRSSVRALPARRGTSTLPSPQQVSLRWATRPPVRLPQRSRGHIVGPVILSPPAPKIVFRAARPLHRHIVRSHRHPIQPILQNHFTVVVLSPSSTAVILGPDTAYVPLHE